MLGHRFIYLYSREVRPAIHSFPLPNNKKSLNITRYIICGTQYQLISEIQKDSPREPTVFCVWT